MSHYQLITLALVLFPLAGALIAGLGGRRVSFISFIPVFCVSTIFSTWRCLR
jgi:hypothetical protein